MNAKYYKQMIYTMSLLAFGATVSHGSVTYWRVDKGIDYLQTADNTQPATPTNWYFYSDLGTDLPGDATSVVLAGTNFVSPIAFEQYGSNWVYYAGFPSKEIRDAIFPSEASYSLILSGGSLGSITQEFSIAADDYPSVPYLSGADYSTFQSLEVYESFEVNWDLPAEPISSVGFEIVEGALVDDGDTVVDLFPGNTFTSAFLAGDFFVAGSDYSGFLQFSNSTNVDGSGGFGVEGTIAFNSEAVFTIAAVNAAIGFDDFNDNAFDNGKWTSLSVEAGKALTETNGYFEFTSDDSADGASVAWGWGAGTLSYTQDWSVAIDIANFIDSGAMPLDAETYTGLGVFHDDFSHLLSVELYKNEYATTLYFEGTGGGNDVWGNTFFPNDQVSLKIGFDADRKMLYTTYSTGGNYTTLTNYSVASWGMTDSSVFNIGMFGGSHLVEVVPGEIHADNFRIYDGAALSNNVGMTELEYLHSYGDGTIFTENNFIKVDTLATHKVRDITFTTASGFSSSLINVWDEGIGVEWGRDIPLGFYTPWNPADDGDWVLTFEFIDGTYQSTVIPFTLEDGITPIPNFFYKPEFLPPSPANGLRTSETSFSLAWAVAGSNALFLSVDEIVNGNEPGDLSMFFTNGISAASLALLDITNAQPISITSTGPFAFAEGFHRMRISEGSGHIAYNNEGVLYTVVKQNESDIIFTITNDVDDDSMPDDWETDFFGSTNAVNGGAYDDFDEDGMVNLYEFIAGVNPTNNGSVFAVENPGPSPSGFVIHWNSVAGREYAVYWAKTLSDPFVSVTTGYLPYPQSSYTDTVHTNQGCGFYFLDVQLQD